MVHAHRHGTQIACAVRISDPWCRSHTNEFKDLRLLTIAAAQVQDDGGDSRGGYLSLIRFLPTFPLAFTSVRGRNGDVEGDLLDGVDAGGKGGV